MLVLMLGQSFLCPCECIPHHVLVCNDDRIGIVKRAFAQGDEKSGDVDGVSHAK
jgi:hypothetical protein